MHKQNAVEWYRYDIPETLGSECDKSIWAVIVVETKLAIDLKCKWKLERKEIGIDRSRMNPTQKRRMRRMGDEVIGAVATRITMREWDQLIDRIKSNRIDRARLQQANFLRSTFCSSLFSAFLFFCLFYWLPAPIDSDFLCLNQLNNYDQLIKRAPLQLISSALNGFKCLKAHLTS